jgi:Protein of unknown function (DUF3106)
MRQSISQFGRTKAGLHSAGLLSLVAGFLSFVSAPVWAQRPVPPPRVAAAQQRQAQRQQQQRQAQAQRQAQQPRKQPPNETPQERRMLDLPPKWADQLRTMPPEQQQRFLNNNQRFLDLPPERQTQIRNQLRQWNGLGPAQQQAILDRERVWQSMTPSQQRYVRDTLMPQWQAMSPLRRQMILRRLHDLRGLDDSQRAAKLNDESFNAGLDPGERQMLRDLSGLRVTESGPPGF